MGHSQPPVANEVNLPLQPLPLPGFAFIHQLLSENLEGSNIYLSIARLGSLWAAVGAQPPSANFMNKSQAAAGLQWQLQDPSHRLCELESGSSGPVTSSYAYVAITLGVNHNICVPLVVFFGAVSRGTQI